MSSRTKVAAIGVGLVMAATTALPASAVTYKWNNTEISYGSLKVRYCDGTTRTLTEGSTYTKDVCKFYLPYNRDAYVWVQETGTLLYDRAYCGSADGVWITPSSRTDTGRTADVTITRANCT